MTEFPEHHFDVGSRCTGVPLGDLGHGVSAELRYVDGELSGIWYRHPHDAEDREAALLPPAERTTGYGMHGWVPVKPAWPDGWTVVSIDPLTLSPSLLCRQCGHHGHIINGRWVPC